MRGLSTEGEVQGLLSEVRVPRRRRLDEFVIVKSLKVTRLLEYLSESWGTLILGSFRILQPCSHLVYLQYVKSITHFCPWKRVNESFANILRTKQGV